ncbi:putative glycolipid-binding domain-containing protein [Chitinophaga caseinilytica]|uniref:Glycolipid-binding domain-containing protein n=1 Tax=Chitinophaga caseinilytica TaxID=2267521 RepID=A0ABZ2Z7A0_9BACT
MKRQIVWKGLYYQMMEYCSIDASGTDIRINGTIVGFGEDVPFSVSYDIVTDRAWQMSGLEMAIERDGDCSWISLHRDINGKWTQTGHTRDEWDHCIDVDISLTPFTNTLPIRRLGLQPGERTQIDALYINVLKNEIKPVTQFYTRLDENRYLYEGVLKDFKREIITDEDGLVIDYPGLFYAVQSETE